MTGETLAGTTILTLDEARELGTPASEAWERNYWDNYDQLTAAHKLAREAGATALGSYELVAS